VKEIFRQWGSKVFLAVADQGAFSGTNFIINILLARWLPPVEYGIFVLISSIFLFISGFHNALILEPMNTIGVARYGYVIKTYVGKTIWLHVALTISLSIFLLLASILFFIRGSSLAAPLIGISIALPFMLLLWLLRTVCYVKTRPDIALSGSVIYLLFVPIGLLLLKKIQWLSPFHAFLLTGFASAIISFFLIKVLKIKLNFAVLVGVPPKFRNILSAHWGYGRWAVGSTVVFWLSGSVYLPMVGFIVGLPQLGALRAIQNLILPLGQIMTALGMLFLPWISRQIEIRGKFWLKRGILKVIYPFSLIALVYIIFILFSGQYLTTILYGDKYYGQYTWMIPYVCFIALIGTKIQLLYIFLKSFQKPNVIFFSQASAAIFSLIFGTYLVWQLKLYGSLLSLLISSSINALIMCIFFYKYLRMRG
jgi:O-antigen/teichoic acid export membrane protein